MKVNECFVDNLSFRKQANLNYIPSVGIDDQNKTFFLSAFCKEIGVDKSSMIEAIYRNKAWLNRGWAYKNNDNRWVVRLIIATKFIEKYRYGKLNTRNGKKWNRKEIETLYSKAEHQVIADKVNKSFGAVKTMRSKLGLGKFKKIRKWRYPFFVTPHAMLQYKKRVLNISDPYLIWNINYALNDAQNFKNTEIGNYEGVTYQYINTRHSFLNFNCVIITDVIKEWPIIITIFR